MTDLITRTNSVLGRIFDDSFGSIDWEWPTGDLFAMPVDVVKYDDRYEITAELSGFSEDGVDVRIDNDLLTIKVNRPEKEKITQGAYVIRERKDHSATRSFVLPSDVDKTAVKASMKDGLLKVVVPKEEKAKPRQIEVKQAKSLT